LLAVLYDMTDVDHTEHGRRPNPLAERPSICHDRAR